jgi:hypothetical protein
VKLTEKIRYKLPGTGSYFNQKALIWRNRGDSTALEICHAVRVKYDEKPNIHELSTGEKIPAVPKDYVGNLYGGGSYFCAVEASDDQLVVWKPKFDLAALQDMVDQDDSDLEELPVNFETGMDGEEIKDRLIDKGYNAVNVAVLDNRDERFTFLSQELETAEDKYGIGSMLWDNMDIVLTVTAAIAVAIVMYTMTGDIVPAIENFADQVGNLNQNVQDLQRLMNQTAPPGS